MLSLTHGLLGSPARCLSSLSPSVSSPLALHLSVCLSIRYPPLCPYAASLCLPHCQYPQGWTTCCAHAHKVALSQHLLLLPHDPFTFCPRDHLPCDPDRPISISVPLRSLPTVTKSELDLGPQPSQDSAATTLPWVSPAEEQKPDEVPCLCGERWP